MKAQIVLLILLVVVIPALAARYALPEAAVVFMWTLAGFGYTHHRINKLEHIAQERCLISSDELERNTST